eukprot:5570809-Alexandrium_andersonii.AAC.1
MRERTISKLAGSRPDCGSTRDSCSNSRAVRSKTARHLPRISFSPPHCELEGKHVRTRSTAGTSPERGPR